MPRELSPLSIVRKAHRLKVPLTDLVCSLNAMIDLLGYGQTSPSRIALWEMAILTVYGIPVSLTKKGQDEIVPEP